MMKKLSNNLLFKKLNKAFGHFVVVKLYELDDNLMQPIKNKHLTESHCKNIFEMLS